jgi:uncharacterized protein (TIGR03086 family)
MGDVAERYRRVGGRFSERVGEVPPGAWEAPAPCEGWVARDVVRHLVEWVPGLVASGSGVAPPAVPSVDEDPAGAWRALDGWLQGLLDDPAVGERRFSHPMAGEHPLDEAIGIFVLGDVLVHTWDLARAAGLDESLDPDEVAAQYAGMVQADEALRSSGHFGPAVAVPEDADLQTKLIAFSGRHP